MFFSNSVVYLQLGKEKKQIGLTKTKLIMKKTFLLIAALIIGATSANAQRFISADALTVKNKAVKNEAQVNLNIKKEAKSLTKDAFVYGTPVMTVNFSTSNLNYTFDNLVGHTAGTNQAKFRRLDTSTASTTILQSTYPKLYSYFGVSSLGYYWFKALLGEENEIGDGYALMSPLEVFYADGQTNVKAYNTAIKCTDGFSTIGFNTVDVIFNQYTMRFNSDRYFIDYSTDANFTTYDSLEFNVKGIEVGSNEDAYGQKRITLPVASSVGKNVLYIRLRYLCPSLTTTNLPSGYRWIVDEINVYDGPAFRVDLIDAYHKYAAYGVIPQGMLMDTMDFVATIDNTGGNTLFGALAEERYHNATEIVYPNVFGSLLSTTNVSATPTDVTTATRVDTTTNSTGVITAIDIRRSKVLTARSARMNNDTAGFFGISSGVKYLESATATNYTLSPMDDSIYYQVSAMPALTDTLGAARWATDVDVLIEGKSFAYGFEDGYIADNAPGSKIAGYEVCNRFVTPDDLDSNTYYAKGVEVVPAADSCDSGIRIKASLKYMDWTATTADDYIKPVTVNSQEVSSQIATTTTESLNNGIFTASGTEYSTSYNSMYMPFGQSQIALKPGQWYYACYKLLDDGRFLAARDDKDYLPTFKTFDWYSKLVMTPGQETEGYAWGYPFGEWFSQYNAPMIRLMVSKNGSLVSSLNDISTPAFNLNAYPNPAQNETNIEYTLNKNGNVIITLTDIMGRNVLTMNKGNQAANATYRVALNTNTLNNGTYFYTLNVNGVKETKKLVINK